jgi:hypothetical protein
MAREKRPKKNRQRNGQRKTTKEEQTTQWPEKNDQRRTDNAMAREKRPKKNLPSRNSK